MKRLLYSAILLAVILVPEIGWSQIQPFLKGTDLSFLTQVETHGGVFRDSSRIKDAIQIFKDHGFNYVRLRIWHSPPSNPYDLDATLMLAERVKAQGMKLLLDFHYSDTWADPAHQTKPAAWDALSFTALRESVYQYTKSVIRRLKDHNTLPDIVQIGNEISCGMLWYDGNVCGSYNTPLQWNNLKQLITAGIDGVRDPLDPSDSIRIMIHSDKGGNNAACRWFFSNLLASGVTFDIIGLSYYPWWHGSLNQLSSNINDLAVRFGKDIIVVETAYPWTLQWYDNKNNIIGDSSQLLPEYPATVEGQLTFLSDLQSVIHSVPDGRGKGVFYWEPAWLGSSAFGSSWENLALFDFTGNVQASFRAFDPVMINIDVHQKWNLISVPVITFNVQPQSLFPSITSSAFRFTSTGYTTTDSLYPGNGYWLKFPANQSIMVAGDSLLALTVETTPGWNLIGSISAPILASRIVQQPPGIVSSAYFRYENGYFPTDTLISGKGYWVKVDQMGKLILSVDQ